MILAVFLSAMVLSACGQKENVPSNVKTAFEQKFPDATKIDWDKENATVWEAEFKMNSNEYSVNFSSDGKWLETEYKIKESDLPNQIKSTIDTKFGDYNIEDAEVLETTAGKVFEFQMEKDGLGMEIVISPDGEVVKKEVKKEND